MGRQNGQKISFLWSVKLVLPWRQYCSTLSMPSRFARLFTFPHIRVLTALLVILVAGCAKIDAVRLGGGNADGFHGGDPLYGTIYTANRTLSLAYESLVNTVSQDARVCSYAACNASQPYCRALQNLTPAQISDCRLVLYRSATTVLMSLGFRPGLTPAPMRLMDGPLQDPSGGGVVAAYTTTDLASPIYFDRERVRQLSTDELMALLVHEFTHKYQAPYIRDNAPWESFANGRAMLDVLGAAMVAYIRDILALDPNGSTTGVNTNLSPVFLTMPNGDLMKVIRSQTQSGFVEVEIASALTAYQQISLRAVIPYLLGPARVCIYALKGNDLVCILENNTGSGEVELHGLSRESNYTIFNMHQPINYANNRGEVQDYRFTATELYRIKRTPTGTNTIEFHPLTAASNYREYAGHWGSDIPVAEASNIEFVTVGDDLLAIRPNANTANPLTVELRERGRAFQAQTPRKSTPILVGTEGNNFAYGAKGRDLLVIKTRNTASFKVEVDILSESSGFSAFLQRLISGFRY